MMTQPERLDYRHGDVGLTGRLVRPDGAAGVRPGILVIHDARGLGPGTVRQAEAFAALGYIVLAADMYGDGAFFADPKHAGPMVGALAADPLLLRARALAGYEALRAVEGVDAGRIAAVGYCFGGRCVLEIARSGADVRAVASVHGILTTDLPAAPDSVRSKVLVLTGALDPYAPITQVEAFRQEMAAAGVDHHITLYGLGWHGFSDEGAETMAHIPGVHYDPVLSRLSFAQAAAFIEAAIDPRQAA